MFEVTNNMRASKANSALSAYAVEGRYNGEDDETILGDLLCDIRHLADAQGFDIETMWETSRGAYNEEIAEAKKADCDFAE